MFLLIKLLDIFAILLVARVLLSWFLRPPYHPAYLLLIKITEPILRPVREILPQMPVDISPIIVFFLIELIKSLIYRF